MGQLLDLAGPEMDAEDVRPGVRRVTALWVQALRAQVVEVAEVDPLGVERDEGIGHRADTPLDQHLLAAVWVEQHQVGPHLQAGWKTSGHVVLTSSPKRGCRT